MTMTALDVTDARPLEGLRIGDGYAALGERFVVRRDPTPLPEPYPIAFNPDVAELIGLQAAEATRPEFLRISAGCARFGQVEPFAAVYSGHQFGSYNPRLGDGRAITLGEIATPGGEHFEWQVKGAGLTAFSRFGDGRAVLRSTIREYLCSEAMAALGFRRPARSRWPGATRPCFGRRPRPRPSSPALAPTHMRFGTFEYFHHTQDFDAVRTLANYAIDRFYPHLAAISDDGERYASFLREIVDRTARTIARWQAVGFAHGVMNTDNMSILGLTIDYGPFGSSMRTTRTSFATIRMKAGDTRSIASPRSVFGIATRSPSHCRRSYRRQTRRRPSQPIRRRSARRTSDFSRRSSGSTKRVRTMPNSTRLLYDLTTWPCRSYTVLPRALDARRGELA